METVKKLWGVINEINDNWKIVEDRFKGLACEVADCPLVMKRVNGIMRLCYKDKPLTDCTADDKIIACQYLQKFVEGWNAQQTDKLQMAVQSNKILRSFIQQT